MIEDKPRTTLTDRHIKKAISGDIRQIKSTVTSRPLSRNKRYEVSSIEKLLCFSPGLVLFTPRSLLRRYNPRFLGNFLPLFSDRQFHLAAASWLSSSRRHWPRRQVSTARTIFLCWTAFLGCLSTFMTSAWPLVLPCSSPASYRSSANWSSSITFY